MQIKNKKSILVFNPKSADEWFNWYLHNGMNYYGNGFFKRTNTHEHSIVLCCFKENSSILHNLYGPCWISDMTLDENSKENRWVFNRRTITARFAVNGQEMLYENWIKHPKVKEAHFERFLIEITEGE